MKLPGGHKPGCSSLGKALEHLAGKEILDTNSVHSEAEHLLFLFPFPCSQDTAITVKGLL